MGRGRELEDAAELRRAFDLLGRLLAASSEAVAVAIVGGSALVLQGFVVRSTRDVDIVAYVEDDDVAVDSPAAPTLRTAADAVAGELGLYDDWLNLGPVSLLDAGLPEGFLGRCVVEEFGSLRVYVASRYDLIHLKLYAAVDQGPNSKHMSDLLGLAPTSDEIDAAARWCARHDPSNAFAVDLASAVEWLGGRADV